ncbi:olfactory receptor 52L1-like [Engystomops pustulosus]|uniref:olfactory receptor 52L1-like n=1 Tax=Engystomops pustulosus TaxID=76066 RepID=UPI003AFB31C2
MENVSKVGSYFVFLGLLEMEKYRIPYAIVALVLFIVSTLLCCLIIYIIWIEESLHEPMYFFISNLLLNGVFGNVTVFPQVIVGLLSGSSAISFPACLIQTFCVQSFSTAEALTFTTMAYDRYLAVGNPLRYSSIMTNTKALNSIYMIWALVFILVVIPVIMTANLSFCGFSINNIFCENMSLVRLACGNTTVNHLFGLVETLLFLGSTVLFVEYCYIRTLLICLKTYKSGSLKAARTLLTHVIAYSIFLMASLFIFLRYRLNVGTISVAAHVILSITGLISSVIVNPIVYGMRTEALKLKLIHNLQKVFS